MTQINTSGVNSCGIMSLSGFRTEDYWLEEKHELCPYKNAYLTEWILYRVVVEDQKPRRCRHHAFSQIMNAIEDAYEDKTIIACLNESQVYMKGEYWKKKLKEWDFELVKKFDNDDGEVNYFFMRIPYEVD